MHSGRHRRKRKHIARDGEREEEGRKEGRKGGGEKREEKVGWER